MRNRLLILPALLLLCTGAWAQVDPDAEFFSLPEEVTDSYLDSVTIQTVKPNNYWLVGGYGGASLAFGYFNPSRSTKMLLNYPVFGASLLRYFQMFGIFANMGAEFGFQYNYEGYEFKEFERDGIKTRTTESGAYRVTMDVPEVFFLSHFHLDMGEHLKLMAKVGMYGGYRWKIQRTLDDAYVNSETYQGYVNAFRDYDHRLTYGVQGSLGFGLMLDPFEIHLNAQIKWGWESFWDPDYAHKYYYRFGYPMDGTVTLGLYYQLTPRHGHTRAQLRKLARKMVEENKQP